MRRKFNPETKYGRLKPILRVGKKGHSTLWLCNCDCGKQAYVTQDRMLSGNTSSCGCLKTFFNPDNKYGRLTIIERQKKNGITYWMCRCDCGTVKTIRQQDLISGKTKSCGCLGKEKSGETGKETIKYAIQSAAKAHTKHSGSKDRLYKIWRGIKVRCFDSNSKPYKNYGGRGITMCAEWKEDYAAFKKWAYSNGYDENVPYGQCTIDRTDNNGNYEPSNCRWVDMKTQAQNRRTTKHCNINAQA